MTSTFDLSAGRVTNNRDDAGHLLAALEAVLSERLDTVQALDGLTLTQVGCVNPVGTMRGNPLAAAQSRLTDLTRAQERLLDRLAALMPPEGEPS